MADAVRIALVFPAVLGTYGDSGNAVVLTQRLRWRGIEAETIPVEIDQPLPDQADLYVLGGGEDSAQALAVSRLSDGALRRAADRGAPVLAVCAGFQILGETWLDRHGSVSPGLGLIDCRTDRLAGSRAVGELLVDADASGLGILTGYENHGGRTVLGPAAQPLGRVSAGIGNGDHDVDGAVQGSVVATYLHGPALARNPVLADHLLTQVVGELAPIDDSAATELRAERLRAVRSAGRGLRRRQWRPPASDG
ncbi:MAG TPA: glutamine amidotransferase [Mycobacteriales bacterium]|nr:glutamine amidotransferase [Mycobacteriales bacterium]